MPEIKSVAVFRAGRCIAISALLLCALASCTSKDAERVTAPTIETAAAAEAPSAAAQPQESEMIANLPYSRGKAFATLDDYLAHLEKNGEIDLPYWKQIGPGLYEWVVRMPGAERKTATREELMQLYGFSR